VRDKPHILQVREAEGRAEVFTQFDPRGFWNGKENLDNLWVELCTSTAANFLARLRQGKQGQSIITKYDAPLATTYFIPVGIPTIHEQNRFKVFPAVVQHGDKTEFRFCLGLSVLPKSQPYVYLNGVTVTVDGAEAGQINYRTPPHSQNPDGVFMMRFEAQGENIEPIVRKIANTNGDVWLVVWVGGVPEANRLNLRLTGEQVETFKMMLSKFDELKKAEAAKSATQPAVQAETIK
jgi:hypothetical protein